MKAMVFAAGLGTRLKPITDTLPKAMVPVAGRPLIEHVILKLKYSGVDEAVVNVHHFAGKIREWVENQDIMRISLSDESDMLLDTGGGILKARPMLQGCGRFIVHNVDILSDLDIRWFASNVPQDAVAALLVSERKTSRYLLFDKKDMRLVGWMDIRTGEVRSPYQDIDPESCHKYAFSGIHILSDTIFDIMDEYADSPRFPIIDFYLWACARAPIYGVVAGNLNLVDVGKLDTLAHAEEIYENVIKTDLR